MSVTHTEVTPCNAVSAEPNSSLNAPDNVTALASVPGPQLPASAGKRRSKNKPAHNAVNPSGNTPAISEPTAQNDVLDWQIAQTARLVQSVGSLCDSCGTAIAHDLASLRRKQSPAYIAGRDSIPAYKKPILLQSLALLAASLEHSDTTPTIAALSMWYGYAVAAISAHTTTELSAGPASDQTISHSPEYDVPYRYIAKASRRERNAGCAGLPEIVADTHIMNRMRCQTCGGWQATGPQTVANRPHSTCQCEQPDYAPQPARVQANQNTHPCVKPVALLSWLVRLVTPPGGVVLDPFMGSGSTGIACVKLGFGFIGCEQDAEYLAIAQARITHARPAQPAATQAALLTEGVA